MRWWGLYTQRTQGVPGERTGSAEPEELEDEFFMMRIRIDGGAMTTEQLRAIAWASERYGRDVADVTDRQNVQLHWIRIEDVPAIWERIESVGLSTQEACGDTPRVILGCPLAGVTADEVFDATPDIRAVAERFVGDPAFSNLPRKYKTSISGCRRRMHEPRDQRRLLRGRGRPRRRARIRPAGGRRPLDEPDVRAASRRVRAPRARPGGLGGRHGVCSASTGTGARATTPA